MTVANWYQNGQDFDEGFDILFRHNPHHALEFKVWCNRSFVPTTYQQQLRIALDALPIVPLDPEGESDNHTITQSHNHTITQTEPPIIKEYRRLWYENTTRFRRVHALLSAATTDAQRAEHATAIMTDIIPQRTRISEVLEAFEKQGLLPISPPAPRGATATVADPLGAGGDSYAQGLRDGAAQLQRIANLTSRINKINNQLLPTAKREKNAEKADGYEAEILNKTTEITTLKQKLGL